MFRTSSVTRAAIAAAALFVASGGTADSKTLTDGLLSLGLQYRFHTHYAMEVRVSHLTSSGVTSTALQAQFPF